MGKYKVVVYAIAKNEAMFAENWAKNMSEADEIYVLLDPTSTDNTKEILEANGVHVVPKQIKPWRFDVARNESLKLVPKDADICVCTDLDEYFSPYWRREIERVWQPNTNQAIYKYYHNANSPNMAPNIIDYSKIHDRKSFRWQWPVHEYIMPKNKRKDVNLVRVSDIMLYHTPDLSKSRSSYLPLLELAVKENKKDTRNLNLLAEEYLNKGEYEKAEKTLARLLKIKNLSLHDKCLTYKFLIRASVEQKYYDKAKQLCYDALEICDYCKIFYGELGKILILEDKVYQMGISMLKKCLKLTYDVIPAKEVEWNDKAIVHNLISIGYYNLGKTDKALEHNMLALKLHPKNSEYLANKKLFESKK